MSEDLKQKIKNMSLTDAFQIYESIVSTKKAVEGNKVEITAKDLKPKRTKKGSKN